MQKPTVSLVQYSSSPDSLSDALEYAKAFSELRPGHRVLIKPNLVRWYPSHPFAPYGVYTTSRLVEDMVILLRDFGITDITIGEGSAGGGVKKTGSLTGARLIFDALGYGHLQRRYGVKLIDFFEEPFQAVEVEGFTLNFARAALETDFLVNMPTLKTHSQTKLSLGLKNLKGCIDVKSRKLCHHEHLPLDFFCGLFEEVLRPSLTVLDGIYGLERGPYFLGTAHRMNLLIASGDPLAVDIMGARVLGYDPESVGHLALYAKRHHRSMDQDAFVLKGADPERFKRHLAYDFNWRVDDTGPLYWDKLGISGIKIRKYDETICTGCSSMFSPLLMLLTSAYKGEAFEGIEVLSGKKMTPSPGFSKTILFGNCMIRKNRKDPNIETPVYIKGCPVSMEEIVTALEGLGLGIEMDYYARFRKSLAKKYAGNPDFEPGHYFMPGASGSSKTAASVEG